MDIKQRCKQCISLLCLLLTGCYEQELMLKEWAKTSSSEYFKRLIRIDAQARTAKVAQDVIGNITYTLERLDALNSQMTLPKKSLEPQEDLTLEKAIERHRFYRDSFITELEPLVTIDSELNDLARQLDKDSSVCETYFENNVIAPIDIGALATIAGKKGFVAYLSLTAALDFSVAGPDINLQKNKNLIEYLVDELINKPIGDIFASDEQKNALEDAKRFLKENHPSEEERRNIARSECQLILTPVLSTVKKVRKTIGKLRQTNQRQQASSQSNSGKSFISLDIALRLRAESERETVERQRIETELFFRRGEVFNRFFLILNRKILSLISLIHAQDYSKALLLGEEIQDILQDLKKFLREDDLDLYKSKYNYFFRQLKTYLNKIRPNEGC